MSSSAVRPFDQKIRIAVLRLFFVMAIPLILFTRSAWLDERLVFGVLEQLGVFMVITAVLGRFWAILYIGALKNKTVMQDGPYSICRHPLYLFSTIGVIGFGLMLGSFVLTFILGGGAFVILSRTAAREEVFLQAEFGQAYADYAAHVPRIWPKLSAFKTEPTVTSSLTAVRTNLFDAMVFLAFIPLAEVTEGLKEMALWPTLALY